MKRGLAIALAVAVIVGTYVFVLPQFANYGEVWDQVKMLSWQWIAILLGAVVLNLATFAPPWMAALPGLGYWRAEKVTTASTASTYLAPGGPAVGIGISAAMLLAAGFRADEVALAVTLTGIWNQLAILFFPTLALALLTLTGENGAALKTIAAIGLAAFVVVAGAFALALSSGKMARRVGDLAARVLNWLLGCVKRGPVGWSGESLARFRGNAIGLLRRRWYVLTLATLAGQLTVFLVLLCSLRALGVGANEVSLTEAFAGWSLARVLGSIPITPGGLGVVELGLTSVLAGFGGNHAGVVAAVLTYRFLTIVPTLVFGAVAAATWRRGGRAEVVESAASPLPASDLPRGPADARRRR
ncbi:MAG TPA: lysylphosphatidylglycerol synthase transmembrane domain-containing protein [Gaiellaceae bacterium]|nr:lysylphosphatidylglycerol synthase transmembrane domain-containing protein [Gaiellaceae bacterium]